VQFGIHYHHAGHPIDNSHLKFTPNRLCKIPAQKPNLDAEKLTWAFVQNWVNKRRTWSGGSERIYLSCCRSDSTTNPTMDWGELEWSFRSVRSSTVNTSSTNVICLRLPRRDAVGEWERCGVRLGGMRREPGKGGKPSRRQRWWDATSRGTEEKMFVP
jgi:hypothetical protein